MPIWTTKHYVWATKFPFLGAQVATNVLKVVDNIAIFL